MYIEVWKPAAPFPFAKYAYIGNSVTIRLKGRPSHPQAFAFVTGSKNISIPVDPGFGLGLLRAREVLCPHAGKLPRYAFRGKGFTCFPAGADGTHTREFCDVCGYTAYYPGNPTTRHAVTGKHSSGAVHPDITYTYAVRKRAVLHVADWKVNRLAEHNESGILIIMIKSRWHLRSKARAKNASERLFPGTTFLFDGGLYIIRQMKL